jgi:hypothetical protein
MNPLPLVLVAIVAAATCVVESAAQAPADGPKRPGIAVDRDGNFTNIRTVDPDSAQQMQLLATIRALPGNQNTSIIPWLSANAHKLLPSFAYELSRRLWDEGRKDEAFEWFAVGGARARYDAFRCVDRTAAQGVMYLPQQLAQNVVSGIPANREIYGKAGLRALARTDLFATPEVSPFWICAHGMAAITAGMEKRTLETAAWLKPESEWAGIRESVITMAKPHFEGQSQPQNDPIPMAATPYRAVQLGESRWSGYAWVDDGRLAIRDQAAGTLSIWNRKDGRLEVIAKLNNHWCAGNGQLSYSLMNWPNPKSQTAQLMAGPPEQMREITFPITGLGPLRFAEPGREWGLISGTTTHDPIRQSPFDCRWVRSEPLSGSSKSANWIPLLPQHGFLALGQPEPQPTKSELLHYRPGVPPVALPISIAGTSLGAIRYYAFKDAYFLAPQTTRSLPASDTLPACRPAWWLHPRDSRLEEVCISTDELDRQAAYSYAPSRPGMLRLVGQRNTPHGQMPGGIYLQKADGKKEKVLEIVARRMVVAPDGCALAVESYPSNPAALAAPLTVVELCSDQTISTRKR